jgi:hypothetical protein
MEKIKPESYLDFLRAVVVVVAQTGELFRIFCSGGCCGCADRRVI